MQTFNSESFPWQVCPPNNGAGLLHSRFLVLFPLPHVFVQELHSSHAPHVPSTKMKLIGIITAGMYSVRQTSLSVSIIIILCYYVFSVAQRERRKCWKSDINWEGEKSWTMSYQQILKIDKLWVLSIVQKMTSCCIWRVLCFDGTILVFFLKQPCKCW